MYVSDLRKVGGFLGVLRFSPTNKADRRDIAEILMKEALNTIKPKPISMYIPTSDPNRTFQYYLLSSHPI